MTLNVVICGFQKRFKRPLTLVMNAFGYVIQKIEQVLTSNSSLHAVQAQDTLQIRSPQCAVKLYFCTALPLNNQLN